MAKTLLLLPGDGIGPEVIAEMKLDLEIEEAAFGGASIDRFGVPITDDAVAQAKAADAVLMGAAGGPQWAKVERGKRPEAGLLRLRKEMGVFANLRPALCFEALADASPLKPELVAG